MTVISTEGLKNNILAGYKLNPNDKVVNGISKVLARNGGVCPCHHEEWNDSTPHEDKLCPCITYRNGQGCHCNLYVKDE